MNVLRLARAQALRVWLPARGVMPESIRAEALSYTSFPRSAWECGDMTLRVAFQHGIHANGLNVDYRHCLDAERPALGIPTQSVGTSHGWAMPTLTTTVKTMWNGF